MVRGLVQRPGTVQRGDGCCCMSISLLWSGAGCESSPLTCPAPSWPAPAKVYTTRRNQSRFTCGAVDQVFRQAGLTLAFPPDIRRMVEFQQSNLAEPWPLLPPMDIVFMRNVLIHFWPGNQKVHFVQGSRHSKTGWLSVSGHVGNYS